MIRRTSHEVLLCVAVCYASDATAFDGWICRVDGIRVGADLRVRCSTTRRVTLCRDDRLVSSGRASVPEPASCIKGYSIVVLTGTYTSCRSTTDAQTVRPYSGLHVSL